MVPKRNDFGKSLGPFWPWRHNVAMESDEGGEDENTRERSGKWVQKWSEYLWPGLTRGTPLLATSPGIPVATRFPRNLLFSMTLSASICDYILVTSCPSSSSKSEIQKKSKWLPESIPERSNDWHGKSSERHEHIISEQGIFTTWLV